jgi:crotonobetainyl-CoA:carnitine CoA-transferase CaiB-like acyl-CoA transferase
MKLDGIRVLDLSLFLPGPYLTQMMADHGAEVIKIEPPSGEPVRNVGYRTKDDTTVWFRNTHRNKKSVVLNLKQDDDRKALLDLCESADVFVEAFRPGAVGRLGVSPQVVRARNPKIVYASISAFGQTGPQVHRPAHDLAIQALAGALSLNLGSDGNPTNPGMPVADIAGSMVALSGILMALLRRQTTGKGDYLDISMADSLMSWMPNVTGPVFAEDRSPIVKNERSFGGYAFYASYQTKDGGHIALGGVEHKFVENLLSALGRPDLVAIATGPNGPTQGPVKQFLEETFASRTRHEWEGFLAGLDVAAAPVLDLREAFHSPQAENRDMLLRDDDGNLHIGLPIKFSDEPGRFVADLPALGAHTDEILSELRSRKPDKR